MPVSVGNGRKTSLQSTTAASTQPMTAIVGLFHRPAGHSWNIQCSFDNEQPKELSSSASCQEGSQGKEGACPEARQDCFFFYAEEARPKIKQLNPKMKFGDIHRKVCEQWKALTKDERALYQEKAAQDKQRYEKEKKAYMEKQDNNESDETGESEEEDGGENGQDKATADKEWEVGPALDIENLASGPLPLRIGKEGIITFDARGLSGNARLSLLSGGTKSPVLKTPEFYDKELLQHPFPKILWYKDSKVEWYDITLKTAA